MESVTTYLLLMGGFLMMMWFVGALAKWAVYALKSDDIKTYSRQNRHAITFANWMLVLGAIAFFAGFVRLFA